MDDLMDVICRRVSRGESLRLICEDEDMPSYSILMLWRRFEPEFDERVRVAYAAGADALADMIVQIADDYVAEKDAT